MIEDGAIIAEDVKIGYYSIIKSGAKIGKGSIIGDFCYIDSGVSIGNNNVVGTAVHIKGNVQIGDSNYISDNTIIGLFGKHIGYHFYQGKVIIGNNNFIGNGCSIDCGNNYLSMEKPELLRYSLIDLNQDKELEDTTIIGDRCYILNGVTIHHNCRIGLGDLPNCANEYDTIICSGCCLNGFVQVRKGAELSSGTFVREFTSLGEGCFTAMLQYVVKDVPPFSFILKNKNVKIADKLVKKFKYNNKNINILKKAFENKRSGLLNIY